MKRNQVIALLGLMAFIGCNRKDHKLPLLSPGASTPLPDTSEYILVVAGQSNGLGIPAPAFDAVENITIEGGTRSGPGYPFAMEVLRTKSRPVHIIQCSVDGSIMASWAYGGANYQACIQRIGSRKVDAILFVQGEAEAQMPTPYPWSAAFNDLVNNFRSHWANVPIGYVQLGAIASPPWNVPNLAHIQAEQAMSERTGVTMVQAPDVPALDGLHRSPDQNSDLGRRLFQALNNNT